MSVSLISGVCNSFVASRDGACVVELDMNENSFNFRDETAPRSKEGKKVVYVNPVAMGCAQWESYRVDVRRRLATGEDVDRLVSISQKHS